MNRESQSLKVVAGVIAGHARVAGAAHAQQIPIPPNGRRNHWPGSGPYGQGVGVCHPARAISPLKTPINTDSAASGHRGKVKVRRGKSQRGS
jgi:hypothetical protein